MYDHEYKKDEGERNSDMFNKIKSDKEGKDEVEKDVVEFEDTVVGEDELKKSFPI